MDTYLTEVVLILIKQIIAAGDLSERSPTNNITVLSFHGLVMKLAVLYRPVRGSSGDKNGEGEEKSHSIPSINMVSAYEPSGPSGRSLSLFV